MLLSAKATAGSPHSIVPCRVTLKGPEHASLYKPIIWAFPPWTLTPERMREMGKASPGLTGCRIRFTFRIHFYYCPPPWSGGRPTPFQNREGRERKKSGQGETVWEDRDRHGTERGKRQPGNGYSWDWAAGCRDHSATEERDRCLESGDLCPSRCRQGVLDLTTGLWWHRGPWELGLWAAWQGDFNTFKSVWTNKNSK